LYLSLEFKNPYIKFQKLKNKLEFLFVVVRDEVSKYDLPVDFINIQFYHIMETFILQSKRMKSLEIIEIS